MFNNITIPRQRSQGKEGDYYSQQVRNPQAISAGRKESLQQ
jgi:hypothetical protein